MHWKLSSLLIVGVGLIGSAWADTLLVTATPDEASAGTTITFQFSPKVGQDGDAVTFDFGDGSGTTVVYQWTCGLVGGCGQTQHAYAGAGTFTVTAAGTIAGTKVSGSTQVVITETPALAEVYVATAAHAPGYNNTTWRTDIEVNNTSYETISYTLALLRSDSDNSTPLSFEFSLLGGRSAHHADVLGAPFAYTGAAAVRLASASRDVLVVSRTYDQLAKGTFGQFVPGLSRDQAVHTGQQGRLIGLSHDPSLSTGSRTNLGLLSLSPAPIIIEVTYMTRIGGRYGTRSYTLKPYEFRQLNRAFEEVTKELVEFGFITVRTLTTGGAFLAYASVVDNVTGDPIFVPVSVLNASTAP